MDREEEKGDKRVGKGGRESVGEVKSAGFCNPGQKD